VRNIVVLIRIENLVIIALALENTSQEERYNRISTKYPLIVLHQIFNVYLGRIILNLSWQVLPPPVWESESSEVLTRGRVCS
jgi:hypothetical protein